MYSEKFKNLVLYVLSNNNYVDEGIKKLNKILYFIDFYYFREHEIFISDVKYAKAEMGPVIDNYRDIFSELTKDGILERDCTCGPFLHKPKILADISKFTSEEIDHIHKILEKYGKLSSSELESISHDQQPWILTAKEGDIIDPELSLLIDDGIGEEVEITDDILKKELVELANNV
jgi:uncharacterized phage-associated protein